MTPVLQLTLSFYTCISCWTVVTCDWLLHNPQSFFNINDMYSHKELKPVSSSNESRELIKVSNLYSNKQKLIEKCLRWSNLDKQRTFCEIRCFQTNAVNVHWLLLTDNRNTSVSYFTKLNGIWGAFNQLEMQSAGKNSHAYGTYWPSFQSPFSENIGVFCIVTGINE